MGQASDPTALACADLVAVGTGELRPTGTRFEDAGGRPLVREVWAERTEGRVDVRHLQRFPLGTSYVAIVERVGERLDGWRAQHPDAPLPILAVDGTGVGRAVLDVIRRARLPAVLWPITVTAGGAVGRDPASGHWTVPKRELISALVVAMQNDRCRISTRLRDTRALVKELATYRQRYTAAANVVYEPWRESDHDDLLFAVAMIAWVAARVDRSRSGGLM